MHKISPISIVSSFRESYRKKNIDTSSTYTLSISNVYELVPFATSFIQSSFLKCHTKIVQLNKYFMH